MCHIKARTSQGTLRLFEMITVINPGNNKKGGGGTENQVFKREYHQKQGVECEESVYPRLRLVI